MTRREIQDLRKAVKELRGEVERLKAIAPVYIPYPVYPPQPQPYQPYWQPTTIGDGTIAQPMNPSYTTC